MVNRKVLFVAYEFPPEGARGTKRALKFIKFLPRYRWTPIVLTVRNPNYDFNDDSLVDELPADLMAYRAATLERRTLGTDSRGVRSVPTASKYHLSLVVTKVMRKLYQFGQTIVPGFDSRILWFPFAVLKGLRLTHCNHVDLLFATGPSFTNHLVGWALKKLTGIPLVLDFRDAWVSDPATTATLPRYDRAVKRLERVAITAADKVVTTTAGIRNDFVKRYGENNCKFIVITNGYDDADFSQLRTLKRKERNKQLCIVHAGTLGSERSPKEFLEALSELITDHPYLKGAIKALFVGQNTPFRDGKTIDEMVREYRLDDVVRVLGFVTRRQSLQYIAEADLLLVLIGRVPLSGREIYGISAKIYDYAASGKPALTIAEEGSSAQMARRLRLGSVVSPDDKEGIKICLYQYWKTLVSTGRLVVDIDGQTLKQFEFKNLTRELSVCFRHAVSNPKKLEDL